MGPATETAEAAALTAEQLQAIAHARRNGRKVSRAALVAAISGWTMAFFALITLLSGLFSPVALLLGAGLGVVAYLEVWGSKRLRRLDDTAPRLLGFNQIALCAMIVIYAAWGLWRALVGPSPYDSYLAAGGATAEMLEPIDELNRAITAAFYAALMGGSVVAQGFAAVYYFSRRRHIVDYLRKTPTWVVETLRMAA